MWRLLKAINPAFPTWDFVYLLQLENYDTKHYLHSAMPRLWKRNFEQRGALTLDHKVKMLLLLTNILLFAASFTCALPFRELLGPLGFIYFIIAFTPIIPLFVALANVLYRTGASLWSPINHKKPLVVRKSAIPTISEIITHGFVTLDATDFHDLPDIKQALATARTKADTDKQKLVVITAGIPVYPRDSLELNRSLGKTLADTADELILLTSIYASPLAAGIDESVNTPSVSLAQDMPEAWVTLKKNSRPSDFIILILSELSDAHYM